MGKTHIQHSVGIIPEFRTNDDNAYKIKIQDMFLIKIIKLLIFNLVFIIKTRWFYTQIFDKIPSAVRKYKNKGFSTNSSVSSKNRLLN